MRTIDATSGIRILDSKATASRLSKVLWITTLGFVFTALGAYLAPPALYGLGIFGLILNIGLIVGIQAASRRAPALALLLFYGFTLLIGFEIAPLLRMYLHSVNGQNVVFESALTTALGMGAMALLAQGAALQLAARLQVGLLCVDRPCRDRRAGGCSSASSTPVCMRGLRSQIFSVLLLVDFMRLRDMGAQYSSPVPMALSIYLDSLNIFLALLQIFGGGNRSRR